jgi:hypothetical protein
MKEAPCRKLAQNIYFSYASFFRTAKIQIVFSLPKNKLKIFIYGEFFRKELDILAIFF